mmetsp:Transcript_10805/g.14542  ORF Transcript_10805/g.14542 Transcript_10805/m.14542 type:complete len:112 (+) Transcript_10805:1157-1492(+)|eukprot:CAMPEP_0170452138 /NCGR_PEP_ID=MMETSP0123-20130129/1142_1 /TAXON_ID=182087 /ORGANISM="Favella ehrenbergii, Strain Fehren 1" /LENGTH=111 /DNA_ID=CAMNT_0010714055 /DNA_START=998 /DNA_END=1333 /DNA_ORIENTATION=+
MILFMAAGVNNAYWLTLLNVTNLDGNMFVNGLILGSAEMLSGIFSGILISYTNPYIAFQTLSVLGIIFNAINQFWAPAGGILAYLTLFIAIVGVGGVYAVLYVLIAEAVPR